MNYIEKLLSFDPSSCGKLVQEPRTNQARDFSQAFQCLATLALRAPQLEMGSTHLHDRSLAPGIDG